MYTADEIELKKRQLAAALLRTPNDPNGAVASVEPRRDFQLYMLNTWLNDDDVKRYMHEIYMSAGATSHVPSKEEFAAELYREARDCKSKDLKLDYMKLLADVMGYIEKKPANVINNNNLVDNRSVMVVPPLPEDEKSIEHWESSAMEQQARLANGS